ncbi:hypothetical protein, unlikely [Trypanosoma brucei gambiense DAL972]|uniref:T. brucei spp.-specific protein n=1 Tax=Trypanosoma brucei gambiense (strain MHOM/CI/86/DAL972) TaxID=679716 RepID=D0A6S1_TRYB9|nr:hypothetical protein, unlikely [Trypanosoma brucei gambiense DAL972]CBH17372.1 hypothetical protein, unlikely [Trypanosoma brucei gambiense DAL972]|eukprot:XP_011779636.1 hypothetical protein, unlikely [Trypanosoma brucei gambiense DAL972]
MKLILPFSLLNPRFLCDFALLTCLPTFLFEDVDLWEGDHFSLKMVYFIILFSDINEKENYNNKKPKAIRSDKGLRCITSVKSLWFPASVETLAFVSTVTFFRFLSVTHLLSLSTTLYSPVHFLPFP